MTISLPVLPSRPGCTDCSLHTQQGILNVGVPTIHQPDSLPPSATTPALIFIGQNPGYNENVHNIPFIGLSGLALRGGWIRGPRDVVLPPPPPPPHVESDASWVPGAYIHNNNFHTIASIYITNLVKCWTQDDKVPKADSQKACLAHLAADLQAIFSVHSSAPVFIVCCGAPASKHFLLYVTNTKIGKQSEAFKQNGLTYTVGFHVPRTGKFKGRLTPTSKPPPDTPTTTITVFHVYHPAAILRDQRHIHSVDQTLAGLRRIITGESVPLTCPTIIPCRPPKHSVLTTPISAPSPVPRRSTVPPSPSTTPASPPPSTAPRPPTLSSCSNHTSTDPSVVSPNKDFLTRPHPHRPRQV